ncbi:hypothetical protein [Glutamicibacter sp. NPDC090743]|uniref:hypothetical protein n=1 Tax=Glutamicibacter sp. NPDC090743 TaxID=3364001 RepID=UPI0037F28E68
MKKRSLWVLPVAVALALTGCSSNSGTEGAAGSSEAPQEQESAGVPALTAEQAAAVAKTLGGDGPNVQVLDSDALSGSLESAKGLIDQMEIEPAKCAEFVSQQGTQDLDGVNMAAAIVVGETGESNSYSVAGYEDTAKLDAIKDMVDAKDLQGCEDFSMSVAGQKVSASAKILNAESDADKTIATHTAMTMNGEEVPGGSYQIQGVVGENVVAVSRTQTGEQADGEAVKALVEELNKAVEEVKATAK